MRTEQEMMELILNFATQDDNIRGAYMNGSRANPEVLKR
jgi:aminoglycoside 6-adenylyltransferase